MSEHDISQSDSDLELNQTDFICDSDSEIEVISESYFDINTIDSLRKKNTILRSKILKGKNINETLKENLSISKNTITAMNQMITELTDKISLLENINNEITGQLIKLEEKNKGLSHDNTVLSNNILKLEGQVEELTCEKKYLESQINDFSKSKTSWDEFTKKIMKNNNFLSRAVCFFFLVSCSGFIYNYNNQINKSN